MRAEQGVPIATARHGDAGDGGGAARLREGLLGRLEEHGVAASAAVADAVVLVEAAGAVVVRRTASPPFAWRASISGGYTTGNLEPKAADQPVTVNVADDPAGPLVGERAQLALAGTARVVVVDRADPAVERVVAGAVGWVVGTDDGPEDAAVAAWSAVREVQPVTARAATKTAAVMIRIGRMVTPRAFRPPASPSSGFGPGLRLGWNRQGSVLPRQSAGYWGHGSSGDAAGGADAGQAGPGAARWALELRAQVGRVPDDRVPRRRRGRAGQPPGAAHDPLLPRGRPGREGQPAAALCRRRRDRGPRRRGPAARLRRFVAAHPSRGQPGRPPGRPDPGPSGRLRPARPGRGRLHGQTLHPTAGSPRGCPQRGAGAGPSHPGHDGISAKSLDGGYEPDRRSWRKVKHTRTADCVVAGYRLHKRGQDLVGSLLLGLYTGDGELAMAGVIGAFPMARRRELFTELQPLVTTFEGHPWDWGAWQQEAESEGRTWRGSNSSRWNPGKELSFVPLRPERVVEVRYDHLEGRRFRHTAQFQRWRPDRDPRSCTYDQLGETVSYDLADVLATRAT